MILAAASLALLAQAQQPPSPAPETDEGRAARCQASIARSPEAALAEANRWRAAGGGLHARQCIGLAYVQLGQWTSAASTFEQAAQEAERAGEARGVDFWVQSGNAWLAGGDAARAITAFDNALAGQQLSPALRGEVRLDRARALVAQNNLAAAREDLDRALALVEADPMAWYLSAALARQQGDLARARTDIARARQLARDNPDIALLAGTIAGQAGDMAEAERIYRQVAEAAPNTDAGRAAQRSLATIREIEVAAPTSPPAPPPPAPRRN
jgi:tetratricopeptide (TPR) repeat protein